MSGASRCVQDENARQGRFGFAVDNTIGGTPQPNGWMDNWVEFFRERRLRHQLDLAGNGRLSDLGEELMANLEALFEGVKVRLCISVHLPILLIFIFIPRGAAPYLQWALTKVLERGAMSWGSGMPQAQQHAFIAGGI